MLLNVPEDTSDFLEDLPLLRGGFASIKVDATVGNTTWRTSIFPSNNNFLLLISKKLASRENLKVGELVTVNLAVL